MAWRCIGCDLIIPWDGKGGFCYTCRCGAHIFYDDEGNHLALPASLIISLSQGREPPHLDYLVGNSNYTSSRKESLIKELLAKGSVWMKDCEQCLRDGTYQRELDREKAEALFEAEMILRSARDGNSH